MDHYNAQYAFDAAKLTVNLEANDSNHAQAQALDIARAFDCQQFHLQYGLSSQAHQVLSEFFHKLATSDFNPKSCASWEGSYSNKNPCLYIFKSRFYVRPLFLKYLDVDRSDVVIKMSCGNPRCVNPYHFQYRKEKNSKLGGADDQLILGFLRSGVSVSAVAKTLGVHRSTIYRKLANDGHKKSQTYPQ
jgi:Helix-turn-helix domain of resolvase